MTPLIRRRLKERFPRLDDADLPLFAVSDDELVQRIARRTHRARSRVRLQLEEIGALVPTRKLGVARRIGSRRRIAETAAAPGPETAGTDAPETNASGVPDDTAQSGMMAMGPSW